MKFKALLYCRDIKPYVHTSKSGYYCMDRDIKEREINSLTFIWDCRFLNGYIPMECDFEVEEIYVIPEKRSKGIGEALFRYTENTVKTEAEYIVLSTATKNWRAIFHFYIDELNMQFWKLQRRRMW